jgi:hypothetical protein
MISSSKRSSEDAQRLDGKKRFIEKVSCGDYDARAKTIAQSCQ